MHAGLILDELFFGEILKDVSEISGVRDDEIFK